MKKLLFISLLLLIGVTGFGQKIVPISSKGEPLISTNRQLYIDNIGEMKPYYPEEEILNKLEKVVYIENDKVVIKSCDTLNVIKDLIKANELLHREIMKLRRYREQDAETMIQLGRMIH